MRTQSIDPRRLLQDSFVLVKPIYRPMLLFFIPGLVLTFLTVALSPLPNLVVGAIYKISIHLVVTGAVLFYAYQKLSHRDATVFNSLQKGVKKFPQLLLSKFLEFIVLLPAFFFLIIPGIYLSIRLAFILLGVVIEDCSVTETFQRSWQLVKGRWWSVFWAVLVLIIIIYLPLILMSIIVGTTFGVSVTDLILDVGSGIPSVLYKLIGGIFIFLINPVLVVYQVLLFMSLVVWERRDSEPV